MTKSIHFIHQGKAEAKTATVTIAVTHKPLGIL